MATRAPPVGAARAGVLVREIVITFLLTSFSRQRIDGRRNVPVGPAPPQGRLTPVPPDCAELSRPRRRPRRQDSSDVRYSAAKSWKKGGNVPRSPIATRRQVQAMLRLRAISRSLSRQWRMAQATSQRATATVVLPPSAPTGS